MKPALAPRAVAGTKGPGSEVGVLVARGLVKRYGGRPVVDGVNLEVRAGEVVGLLGPNGAGKTTTFYLMVGLVRPDGGEIALGDVDLTRLPVYKRSRLGLAYLAQEPSVFRRMTVEDNLRAVLELCGIDGNRASEVVASLLAQFGLEGLRRARASSLSGGERRRAEVARALALDPRFLLLDEPFTGVDPIAVSELQHTIRSLVGQGLGVLITDHNVRETLAITDRAYIIHQGRILVSGPSDAIAHDTSARRYYLGEQFAL